MIAEGQDGGGETVEVADGAWYYHSPIRGHKKQESRLTEQQLNVNHYHVNRRGYNAT